MSASYTFFYREKLSEKSAPQQGSQRSIEKWLTQIKNKPVKQSYTFQNEIYEADFVCSYDLLYASEFYKDIYFTCHDGTCRSFLCCQPQVSEEMFFKPRFEFTAHCHCCELLEPENPHVMKGEAAGMGSSSRVGWVAAAEIDRDACRLRKHISKTSESTTGQVCWHIQGIWIGLSGALNILRYTKLKTNAQEDSDKHMQLNTESKVKHW